METKEKRLLTVKEVVEHLRLGRTSVNNYLWTGQLPSVKLGRRRLVRPDDLADFIRKNQITQEATLNEESSLAKQS